jgi:hypothetical protein
LQQADAARPHGEKTTTVERRALCSITDKSAKRCWEVAMKQVTIRECPSYIMEESREQPMELSPEIYLTRLKRLHSRIREMGLDAVVLYGDREHFANIAYFSKYDCRFEEALFILRADGSCTIVVGNEGEAYCKIIPYEIHILRYQNFSLQGQPRSDSPSLREIFARASISVGMAVGLSGYKYYDDADWFDVPEYIVQTLRDVVGHGSLINFTRELTGLPNGLRMTIRSAEEIAEIHRQAEKVANVMRRMFSKLRPGISELELSRVGGIDFAPQQTHSMVNFGEKSVSMGIKSPSPFVRLERGGPMSMAFSQRGSLMCRAALAAEDMGSVLPALRPSLESHLMPYWSAVALWYEQLCVGCSCGKIYDQIHEIIGDPQLGFTLNPGHYIGGDEWVNTEFRHGSEVRIHSGSHIQCDIIAAASSPIVSAICEDTVVVAEEGLRLELKTAYPELYQEIAVGQQFMRDTLGIDLHEDVLPMSTLNAVMFPFMLNTRQMFALE